MADKKKKRKYNSITYLTGCPALNLARFNQALSGNTNITDKDQKEIDDFLHGVDNGPTEASSTPAYTQASQALGGASEGPSDSSANSSDGGSAEGGLGEALLKEADEPEIEDEEEAQPEEETQPETEEPEAKEEPVEKPTATNEPEYVPNKHINKREVKRYYIRPQNVFCANKKEIVTELVKLGNDNNCSIYTLNNLPDDDKDVHKLTNRDIIYYYDDGILYDKNHVKVMDYDLFIRKEEERKRFPGGVDSVTDQEFDRVYADRVTETLEDNPFEQEFESFNAFGEKLTEGKVSDDVCCICGEPYEGYGNNAEPYAHGYCCDACNLHFVIPARLAGAFSNKEEDEDEKAYDEALKESLKEAFNEKERQEFTELCDKLGLKDFDKILKFANEHNCSLKQDDKLLQCLRDEANNKLNEEWSESTFCHYAEYIFDKLDEMSGDEIYYFLNKNPRRYKEELEALDQGGVQGLYNYLNKWFDEMEATHDGYPYSLFNDLNNYFTSQRESLGEEIEEKDIPTEFDDQMDFLAADEAEAIEGYEKVIDKVEDEHVQGELEKIETEEKAHKDYLEKVKEDPTIDYEEPLMDEEEELEEAYDYTIDDYLEDLAQDSVDNNNCIEDYDTFKEICSEENFPNVSETDFLTYKRLCNKIKNKDKELDESVGDEETIEDYIIEWAKDDYANGKPCDYEDFEGLLPQVIIEQGFKLTGYSIPELYQLYCSYCCNHDDKDDTKEDVDFFDQF